MLKKLPLALALLSAGSTFAAIPLNTDDTGTQGTGGNQIEVAFTRDKTTPSNDRSREIAAAYTRGITETLDLFIEQGRVTDSPTGGPSTSGYGNTLIGAKWRVWENERKTSVALKGTVALPVSTDKENNGLGTGKTSYDAVVILTQEMAWGSVNANLATARAKFRNSAFNTDVDSFSVAPILNVNEHLKLALDLGVDRSENGGVTTRSRYAEVAAIYAPSESLEFGLGFTRATDRTTKDVTKTISGGLTWRFK